MKKATIHKFVPLAVVVSLFAFASATPNAPKVGVVNFKSCVEGSKLGKQEQARFEELRKQIEGAIEAKEKEANDMAPKFSEEYLDTLTPEAESELKAKFGRINQELNQLQSQYYNTMNQANYQIIQKINESIAKAAETVAKTKGLDMAINQEMCFYNAPALDISKEVIAEMDTQFAVNAKDEKK